MEEVVDVVVRCRNEMPYTEQTIVGLLRQSSLRARILFMDCGSTDGSREAANAYGLRIEDVAPERYVPGVVLNRAMRETSSEIVAFVNADAVPQSSRVLADLVAPLKASERTAATFGRQVPRKNAERLVSLDYQRAFGAESVVRTRRGLFFSMAASAVRRSVWRSMPFDERLQYSEDVDWTSRVAGRGFEVRYVPEATFEHSHNYTLREEFRRRQGEGQADARIYELDRPSIAGDLMRPLLGALLRDARAGEANAHSVATRTVQATGYYAGRVRGVRS